MPEDYTLSSDNPIASMDGPRITPDGKPITPRIKSVNAARAIYQRYWRADSISRGKRAVVQGMVDSEPPFDADKMKRNGMASATNVDFRYGVSALEKAMAPYLELEASVPTLLNIKTGYGKPSDRVEWEEIMSEEWAKMLRSWDKYDFLYLYCIQYFLIHGVSACYFNDAYSWYWNVTTLGEMVLPRGVKAADSEIPVVCLNKELQPEELYAMLHDRKDDCCYNRDAIIAAIMDAAPSPTGATDEDWEKLEREIKGNSLEYSGDTADVTKVVFMLALEVDGSVTQYIFPRDPSSNPRWKAKDTGENFIYKKHGHFKKMGEAITIFTYGIGSDCFIHSVRGFAARIYPIVDSLNRLKCKFIDALVVEAAIPIKASDEALNEMTFTMNGPFMIYHQDVEVMDHDNPNYSNSLIPGFAMLDKDFNDQMVGYTGDAPSGNQEKSKYQFQVEAELASGLKVSQSSVFYKPRERFLKEVLRRTIRKDYDPAEEGGREVADFRLACFKRGVPGEAIDQIDLKSTTVTRAIGNGSPAARISALNQLGEQYGRMDEQGKRAYDRDKAAAAPGMSYDAVRRYFPAPEDLRPSLDVSIAQLENFPLMNGGTAEILPNQPHLIHIQEHLKPMLQLVDAVAQGTPIEEVVIKLAPLHEHATEHLILAGETELNQEEVAKYNQVLQQVGEIVVNGQKRLQKLQKEAQEGLGAPQEGQSTQAPDRSVIEAQIELERAAASEKRANEEHAIKMDQLLKKGAQDRALKDAAMASKI